MVGIITVILFGITLIGLAFCIFAISYVNGRALALKAEIQAIKDEHAELWAEAEALRAALEKPDGRLVAPRRRQRKSTRGIKTGEVDR